MTEQERAFWLRIREARLMELTAIEDLLKMERTKQPKRRDASIKLSEIGDHFFINAVRKLDGV